MMRCWNTASGQLQMALRVAGLRGGALGTEHFVLGGHGNNGGAKVGMPRAATAVHTPFFCSWCWVVR